MKKLTIAIVVAAFYGSFNLGHAQEVKLHVNPRWNECSFEIDPSLTQQAWHQFTREAGLVAYFRPLVDAKPLGKMNFEIALLQWSTAFDDKDPAWNDTFVHPDSLHWLKEGSRLPFPGLTARIGITDKLDAAFYITKSMGANYGFYGGQLQYNLTNNEATGLATSTRVSYTRLYGPEDFNLNIYGIDVLASKEFEVLANRVFIAPYVGVSTYLSHSSETTGKVELDDEDVVGLQTMAGAVVRYSAIRLAAEYNYSSVDTFSLKVGVAF